LIASELGTTTTERRAGLYDLGKEKHLGPKDGSSGILVIIGQFPVMDGFLYLLLFFQENDFLN